MKIVSPEMYEEPKMELVVLPTAEVFTLFIGSGDDVDPDPIDSMGRDAWLQS